MSRSPIHAHWQASALVIDDPEATRTTIDAATIFRVVLVCPRGGESPLDLDWVVIETVDDFVLVPAASGIAGCIHFERRAFWARRPCVHWVESARAPLPPALGVAVRERRRRPAVLRVPRAALQEALAQWPLEGPQTWEQRKWARIVRERASAFGHDAQPA